MSTALGMRGCPVCHSLRRRVVFRQEFAVVEQATPVTGYDVSVCEVCGCGYADGIPEQDVFDRYYRDMSKYEYHQRDGAESAFDRRRLDLIADVIAPHLASPTTSILDVGCATGRLLANLRDRGFTSVTGLDPSPACAAAADRLYRIPVRTMTLGELAATDARFDVVIMIGVLEHLCDLDDAFVDISRILNTGGLLYVEVPDATGFADWPNAPYQDFSTEHINFFAPVSLDNLMNRHGFGEVFRERNHREQSFRTVMSNVSALYRRDLAARPDLAFDEATADGLERYVAACKVEDHHLQAQIDDLASAGRPILVWGVGTHTTRLLATSRLSSANIVAFIESNSRYHGKTLQGRPILAPAALRRHPEPVLISSRVFQHEIAAQIRELGCPNDMIVLYHV